MALDIGVNLLGRSFLTLRDFNAREIEHLLQLSARLKEEKRAHREIRRLAGRNIALIFEKDSTRTRIGFEVAAYDQGAHVTYLGPSGSHVGKKESVKDTARVLGRVYDAIEFRGFHQSDVETLASYSGVPVYNGLTDEDHPTQVLADLLTIREHVAKPLRDVVLAFVGDAHGNMGDELLIGAATMGMDLRIVAPRPVSPRPDFLDLARGLAAGSGARITITDEGCGFDWQRFLVVSPDRMLHSHGRGIAMARGMSFDRLEYRPPGNRVIAEVQCGDPARLASPELSGPRWRGRE